jgi:hypothetical protein
MTVPRPFVPGTLMGGLHWCKEIWIPGPLLITK